MKPPIKAEVSIDAEFYLSEDGQVYVRKLVTNELPAMLSCQLIDVLNQTIMNYYNHRPYDQNYVDSNQIP